jgi:hypothetical protein
MIKNALQHRTDDARRYAVADRSPLIFADAAELGTAFLLPASTATATAI